MGEYRFYESMYDKNGAPLIKREKENGILLEKAYSSIVYCPDSEEKEPGSMYPRAIQLTHQKEKNGRILATFECYSHDTPVFPIFASDDLGKKWKQIGAVEDQELGYGCRYQPHLYELPRALGDLQAGTILCAGNVIPDDYSKTKIRLYKSEDGGTSWTFLSEIVEGGAAFVDLEKGKERPVWEPFLLSTEDGKLYCFYSDERYLESKGYNQLLAHKISLDGGKSWGEEKIDVAFPDGLLRPGMPVITELKKGTYAMVYEMVNQEGIPVYFRMTDDLNDWGEEDFIGNPVLSKTGAKLSGTPYICWIPYGGEEGTLLASGRCFSHIMTNSEAGYGFWKEMHALVELDNLEAFTGYSQCLVPIEGGKKILNLCPVRRDENLAMIQAVVANVYVMA